MDPCGKSVILTDARKIRIKIVYDFYPSDIFHVRSFVCSLVSQLGSLRQKSDPGKCIQNSHESRLCCFTNPTFDIFIPLVVPWGPNLDPCYKSVILTGARKIRIKVGYVFFTHQALSIFIPLAVPWDPNLDPCYKSVILTGARKIRIKVVQVFAPIRHFPCSPFWLPLGVATWILAAKV